MKYICKNNIKCCGINSYVEIWETSRGGTKSPSTLYYRYNNRWISPFEQKIRNWEGISLTILFKLVYSDSIKDLIRSDCSIFNTIKKYELISNYYYIPVIFGK